jgi:hypothetical protein
MLACEMKPEAKKAMVSAVGEELVARHGKKTYYEPDQLRKAAQGRGYPIDLSDLFAWFD